MEYLGIFAWHLQLPIVLICEGVDKMSLSLIFPGSELISRLGTPRSIFFLGGGEGFNKAFPVI